MDLRNAVLVLPPARISHNVEDVRAMPDCHLTVIADRQYPEADESIVLAARRVPVLGNARHWTAALAWLDGLEDVRPEHVDVVVSLELFSISSYQALRLARRLGVGHAIRIAENLPRKPPYVLPPWRQVTRTTAHASDAFVCITEGARAAAERMGCLPERTAVVPHGVDVDLFSPRADGPAPDPVVVFVGELRPLKGVLDLVAAFDRVVRTRSDARLVLIGTGPLDTELQRLAATRPWLDVLGSRNRTDVADTLRNSRAFAMPSKSGRRFHDRWVEQFGFALVEAMSCGIPVVTTRCGAIPEIVPPWNPIVPEADIEQLADGILQALGPDGTEIGRRNREFTLQHYDLRTQGLVLRETLRQLLN